MAKNKEDADWLIFKWLFTSSASVSEEEVDYYSEHPDQIDEVTASLSIHKLFLVIGLVVGTLMVAVAKAISHSTIETTIHPGVAEFLVDIIFEIGVALIGAAITAYFLGAALNQQQDKAKKWRAEIRRQIEAREQGKED